MSDIDAELGQVRRRDAGRIARCGRGALYFALREQGLGVTESARRVGLSRRTLQRGIKEGDFPETRAASQTAKRL